MLHGGPRGNLKQYRVLELGCGDGSNLIPLAYYRRNATFIGVDFARTQIEIANSRKATLGLSNLELIHADFRAALELIPGTFDYIIAHGIFSWVPVEVRDALLEIFKKCLRHLGLLYLNYNTRPGWNVRGMVRRFLLARTSHEPSLRARATLAMLVAEKLSGSLAILAHPYSRLLANEFDFVARGHPSWVAHEYLSRDNHFYWRSQFLKLIAKHGLAYVCDADFNYASSRVPADLAPAINEHEVSDDCPKDALDFLCYRQLHSPILTTAQFEKKLPEATEFGELVVASPLVPAGGDNPAMFKHPSGYEVDAKQQWIADGLKTLQPLWPGGLQIKHLFPKVEQCEQDLRLLHFHGLIDLRCVEPADMRIDVTALHRLESEAEGFGTSLYHQTVRVRSDSASKHSKTE